MSFFLNIYLLSWSSAHHEEQSVQQPPCCCGLPLGPPGQRAALPAQPAPPGCWHGRSRDSVCFNSLTKQKENIRDGTEKVAGPSWRCSRSVDLLIFRLMVSRSIFSSTFLTLLLLLFLPCSLSLSNLQMPVSVRPEVRSLSLEYASTSGVEQALMGIEPLILGPAVL